MQNQKTLDSGSKPRKNKRKAESGLRPIHLRLIILILPLLHRTILRLILDVGCNFSVIGSL